MENIKLVLCDIDGTFIDDDLNCPQDNKDAIRKLREAGILFGFATGRPVLQMQRTLSKWGLENDTDIIMGSNGAELYFYGEDLLINNYCLSAEQIIDIEKKVRNLNVCCTFYDNDYLVSNRITDTYLNRVKAVGLQAKQIDYAAYVNEDHAKLLLVNQMGEQNDVLAKLKELNIEGIKFVSSSPILIEVVDNRLSKSQGISKICEHFNLTKDNVMCFGDANNDYEMIRDYVGVAMENASEEVKSVAKYHTLDNNHAGVAYFINEKLLDF